MENLEPQTIVVMFKNIDDKLIGIHEQVIKTNGQVASLKQWRAYITGGLAVLTMLVIPVLIVMVSNYFQSSVSAQSMNRKP